MKFLAANRFKFFSSFFGISLLLFCSHAFSSNIKEPEVLLVSGEKEAEPLKVPLSIAQMSPVLKSMIEDLEAVDLSSTPIPLSTIKECTLKAVLNSLKAVKNNEAKEPFCFQQLLELVQNSFSSDNINTTSDNYYLDYFQAVNFLNIQNLIKPALANLMLREIGLHLDKTENKPKTKAAWLLTMAEPDQLVKKAIPKEFHSFINDFKDWSSSSGPGEEHLAAYKFKPNYHYSKKEDLTKDIIKNILAYNNKLYIAAQNPVTGRGRICIIDIESKDEIQKPIELDGSLEDLETTAMAINNNKLYVAHGTPGLISVIDLESGELFPLIFLGSTIHAIASTNNKLFINHSRSIENNWEALSVIDLNNNNKLRTLGYGLEGYLAATEKKLYLADPNFGQIMDLVSYKLGVGEHKLLPYVISAIVVANNKLYALKDKGEFFIMELDAYKVTDKPIKFTQKLFEPQNSTSMTATCNKVFITNSAFSTIWVIDLYLNNLYCPQ